MASRIRHIAIVSDQYALEGKFYEAVFGMTTADKTRPERAVTVSDGYLGLNINPRKAGRPAGLDHFGIEVDDLERVLARLAERYPAVEVLKRPATRPFAGVSTHDPAGNIFDLSQQGLENRTSVYVERLSERVNELSEAVNALLKAQGIRRKPPASAARRMVKGAVRNATRTAAKTVSGATNSAARTMSTAGKTAKKTMKTATKLAKAALK